MTFVTSILLSFVPRSLKGKGRPPNSGRSHSTINITSFISLIAAGAEILLEHMIHTDGNVNRMQRLFAITVDHRLRNQDHLNEFP